MDDAHRRMARANHLIDAGRSGAAIFLNDLAAVVERSANAIRSFGAKGGAEGTPTDEVK